MPWDSCRDLAQNRTCCLRWERGSSVRLPGRPQVCLQPQKNPAPPLVFPGSIWSGEGASPIQASHPRRSCTDTGITTTGSLGLCCDKCHLHLKAPCRISLCCPWENAQSNSSLSICFLRLPSQRPATPLSSPPSLPSHPIPQTGVEGNRTPLQGVTQNRGTWFSSGPQQHCAPQATGHHAGPSPLGLPLCCVRGWFGLVPLLQRSVIVLLFGGS